jgi:fumarate hydratase class II
VDGITANEERCRSTIEQSLALCAALVPIIGYDQSAAIAKEAFETGKIVRQVALDKDLLPADQMNGILDRIVLGTT